MEELPQVQLNDESLEGIDMAPNEESKISTEEVETQTDRIKVVHIKAGTTVRDSAAVFSPLVPLEQS